MQAGSACLGLRTVTGTPPFDPWQDGCMFILLNQTFFLDLTYFLDFTFPLGLPRITLSCLYESRGAVHEGHHLNFLPPDPGAASSIP